MLTPVEVYLLSSTAVLMLNALLLSTTNYWLAAAGNIVLSSAGLALFIVEITKYG